MILKYVLYDMNKTDMIAKIEAALYAAGRPLTVFELAKACGTRSTKNVLEFSRELMNNINETFVALEMLELDGKRFVIQLKPKYTNHARKFSSKQLLSSACLKTLSYVVYFQPISGKDLADRRGPNSYQHIKILNKLGFIRSEPFGRTKLFRTTKSFSDYFGISQDPQLMKQDLTKGGLAIPIQNSSKKFITN